MRVAIEVSYLDSVASVRGLGRHTRHLLEAQALLSEVTFVPFSVYLHPGRIGELRSVPARRRALRAAKADVDHTISPYLLGRVRSRPWVVTVHDLIPLLVACHGRSGIKASLVHRWASRADAFLAISDFTGRQLTEHLDVAPERIVVAPQPAAPMEWSSPATSEREPPTHSVPYALAMADFRAPDPRKRLEWLEYLGSALADVGGELVVVGGASREHLGASRGIRALGLVTDEELRALLRGARVFAFSSAYEGQGLPPLEAMSCGTPVVAMRNTSLPQVVGTGGVLVEEETPDWAVNACSGEAHIHARTRFVEACVDLFCDEDRLAELHPLAVEQAASFSRARFADGLRSAYELAMGGSL